MFNLKFNFVYTLSAVLLLVMPAYTAEKVVIRYSTSVLQPTIPMTDLVELAETGNASRELLFYLEHAKQSPENLRLALTTKVPVHGVRLSQFLNSLPGELLLDALGEVIQTSANVANRQALRGALVKSALPDNQLTLLEVMQNYPSDGVYLDGDRLSEIVQRIQAISQALGL